MDPTFQQSLTPNTVLDIYPCMITNGLHDGSVACVELVNRNRQQLIIRLVSHKQIESTLAPVAVDKVEVSMLSALLANRQSLCIQDLCTAEFFEPKCRVRCLAELFCVHCQGSTQLS